MQGASGLKPVWGRCCRRDGQHERYFTFSRKKILTLPTDRLLYLTLFSRIEIVSSFEATTAVSMSCRSYRAYYYDEVMKKVCLEISQENGKIILIIFCFLPLMNHPCFNNYCKKYYEVLKWLTWPAQKLRLIDGVTRFGQIRRNIWQISTITYWTNCVSYKHTHVCLRVDLVSTLCMEWITRNQNPRSQIMNIIG